jgi:hypothetical protein
MLAEEGSTMKIAVGDEVRVHYHPPGPRQSFVEGVVSRVEVSTLRGRVFVVDATYEVILDREQPIKSGYQNYVLYERWEEFPGRIEVLSERPQEAEEPSEINSMPHHQPEIDPPVEAEATLDQYQVEVEPQPVPKRAGLMATLFGGNR